MRFEAYNVTNHVAYGDADLNPKDAAFGFIGSQGNTPRRIETALRLVF